MRAEDGLDFVFADEAGKKLYDGKTYFRRDTLSLEPSRSLVISEQLSNAMRPVISFLPSRHWTVAYRESGAKK